MKLLAGSSNIQFATALGEKLGIPLVATELSTFANGERKVRITEHLAGEDVVLVQSFSEPVNEHIMEFLLLVDATERLGARNVHVIIPWMGYSLQDKVFLPGEPVSAKVIANLVSTSFVRRVYLLDLHSSSIPAFFSTPTAHLSAMESFAQHVQERFDTTRLVVASPDFGGMKRARQFAKQLQVPLVSIVKHRDLKTGAVTAEEIHGSVKGNIVVLFDDVIMSGGTVRETSDLLKKNGAAETHFYSTHGVFTNDAKRMLAESSIDSIVITNSLAHKSLPEKISTLDITPAFASQLEDWL